jgi:hypothetical protein
MLQLHHYGSGINAIPLLAQYRETPEDFYLLRVGYAGTMGALTNVDQEGFASAAFHAFPDMLKFDPYSADYGPNFFGHAVNTGTYVARHPEFGWIAFGGNIATEGKTVRVTPLDSFRTRVYLASLGLWLTLDCGQFEELQLNPAAGTVNIKFAPANQYTPEARLRVEQPYKAAGRGSFRPAVALQQERGAYVVPLQATSSWIELTPAAN